MSKDTPEANEIWTQKGRKDKYPIRILGIYKSFYGDYVHWCYFCEADLEIENDNIRMDKFLENYTYLGKSKANIDDLFKTENEE